jgi:3-hydroxyacyl-CoA dehydrogenase
MSSARARKLLLALIAAGVVAFFVLDLGRYLTVEEMAARREAVQAYRAEHPAAVALAFLLAYVAMAAVSLPGASLMTLAGGAVFGLGFPPFRGGPFRWADEVGPRALLEKVEGLRARFGDRFEPAPLLVEHGRAGRPFHG